MARSDAPLREIAWFEIFPGLLLVRTVRLAMAPGRLLLSLFGVLGMYSGWRLLAWLFGPTDDPTLQAVQRALSLGTWPWDERPAGSDSPFGFEKLAGLPTPRPTLEAYDRISAPFLQLFNWQLSLPATVFLLLCGLWAVVVWSLFGGALVRSSALTLAREDRLGMRAALLHGLVKWPSYFAATLYVLSVVALATIPIALLGWLARLDLGLMITGSLWFLVLIGGFFAALLLLGLAFGWPLMWATIGCEGTDAFDSLGRGYSYVYQRPLVLLLYVLFAMLLGWLGALLVGLFVSATMALAFWMFSWGAGIDRIVEVQRAIVAPETAAGALYGGSQMVAFWNRVLLAVLVAFNVSYFWSASTGIYLLMRRAVDHTEMDEVHVVDEAETYGLPPLAQDEAGVPVLAPEAAPQTTPTPPPAEPSSGGPTV